MSSPSFSFNSYSVAVKQNFFRLTGLLSSHLFIDIYNSLLPIISPLLIQKYNLSLGMMGFLSASLSFSGAFLQPVYGYLCDRFPSKWFVLSAPLLIVLAVLGISFIPCFWGIFFCLLCLGTGFSLYHPKTTAMVGNLSENHRSTFLSFFVASGSLGSTLSPLFILLFLSSSDQNNLSNLKFSCIPAILAFISLLMAYKNYFSIPIVCTSMPRTDIHTSMPRTDVQTTHKPKLTLKRAFAFCAKPNLIILSSIVALRSATVLTLIAFIAQLITSSWEQSLKMAGLAACVLNIGSLIGGLTGGLISEKINSKLALGASLILAAPCLWAFLNTKSLLFLALGAFFSAWSNSICVSLSQKEVPARVQSIASSLTMGFAWGLGAMIIPLVGLIADHHTLLFSLNWFIPIPLIMAGFMCLFLI